MNNKITDLKRVMNFMKINLSYIKYEENHMVRVTCKTFIGVFFHVPCKKFLKLYLQQKGNGCRFDHTVDLTKSF